MSDVVVAEAEVLDSVRTSSSQLSNRSVLVTGAGGFIGSHLVDHLLALGAQVVGVDDFDPWYAPAVKRANLAPAQAHRRFTLVEADLNSPSPPGLNADWLPDLMGGIDVVFHLAGRPGVQGSWGSGFAAYSERNVTVTQRVFEAAMAAGVSRVVYASSSSVYGSSSGLADRTPAPLSPYGVSKLAGEHLAGVYRARGLSITSLRYFTVYGPRQRPDMAIHRLFRAAMADGPAFVVRGNGGQRREFTHVSDVVAATVAAGWRDEAADATIDIGGGSSRSMRQVITMVEALTGSPVRLGRGPAVPGDPASTMADHEPAQKLLAWTPVVGLAPGLATQWAWHQQVAARTAATRASSPVPSA